MVIDGLGFRFPAEAQEKAAPLIAAVLTKDDFIEFGSDWASDFSLDDIDRMHVSVPSPGRQVFVNLGAMKGIWKDALIGAIVAFVTVGNPLPGVLAAALKAVASLQVLDEDEGELVHVLLQLSDGNAYTRSVPEDRVRAAYKEALVSIDDLIDGLLAKDVIARHRDGIRLVL